MQDKKFVYIIISLIIFFFILSVNEKFLLLPPMFNFPTRMYRPTRNMSYDIRGDPVVYPRYNYIGPWLNSELMPYYYY